MNRLGCNSKDPDNDEHNWPEYTENEGGDEVSTCNKCGVDFFGFSNRQECYLCHSGQLNASCPLDDSLALLTKHENHLTRTGKWEINCTNCTLSVSEDFIIGKGELKAKEKLLSLWNKNR